MTTQITTLPPAERAVVALGSSALEIHLTDLVKKHADIVTIANKDGREQVHAAAMVLRKQRTTIAAAGKGARDDAAKFCKAVIDEEKRLIGLIEPEEDRLIKLRDDWDAEREAEKQAAIAKEAMRRKHIEEMIDAIRNMVFVSPREASASIEAIIAATEALDVSEATYEEFAPAASRAKAETLESLRETLEMAKRNEAEQSRIKAAQEAEAARLAAEREELAKLRAEAAERQRVEAEAAEAARKAAAEKIAAERAELEAQQRAIRDQQAEIERQQQAIKAEQVRQAAEARAAAERKAAAERAEAEAKLAAERAAAQAKTDADAREAAEKLRAEQEKAGVEAGRKLAEEAAAARKKREATAPEAEALVEVVAEAYDVSNEVARGWLGLRFGLKRIGFDLAKDAAV